MPDQLISQIFLVPQKDGSKRPLTNLKPLNFYIAKNKFKMEGARAVRDLIRENENTAVISRVDAGEECMPQSYADPGAIVSGPRIQAQQPAEKIYQLASRSICDSHERLKIFMAERNGVCSSPICTNRQVPAESTPRRLYDCPDNPNMGHTTLVPSSVRLPGGVPTTLSCTREAAAGSFNRIHSLVMSNQLRLATWKVSGNPILQMEFRRASNLIISGWSEGTNNTY